MPSRASVQGATALELELAATMSLYLWRLPSSSAVPELTRIFYRRPGI
jgi:hypothetical protein